MKKKYQVFISSTYRDLEKERMAVTQCLLDNDCIPVGMEQFPASGMSQMEYIKKLLDDCDYYILISAGRYGSLDEDGVGFTEKEFDYAVSIGIPVMAFLVDDIGNLPSNKCESSDDGRKRLNAFREKVKNERLVSFFDNTESLKAKVITSIHKAIIDSPRPGWIRGDSIKISKDLEEQVMDIVRRNTTYASKEDIEALFDKVPKIRYGSGEPPADLKEGEIYLQYE